ncbi:MAG: glycosyltransferase family 4 protein [Sedimenticola sp.]
MKILCLSKRRPQGKDLVEQPYGRFYYLPRLLAERGHKVKLHLLSYQREACIAFESEHIEWDSRPLLPNPLEYAQHAEEVCKLWRPDWIIAFSDIWYGILASHLAMRYGIKYSIDAYDDYESYMPWAKPAHWLWRKSLRNATIISATGPGLGSYMCGNRGKDDYIVVPMAADNSFTSIKDKTVIRRRLGIPEKGKIIGYCGSIYPGRGINILFTAFSTLKRSHPDITLVLSGRIHPKVSIPEDAVSLGYLSDEKLPDLIGCLDVLAVVNKISNFGRHSYPVKLYEAMSCGIPVAATKTPATEWILKDHPEMLATPEDADNLSSVLQCALDFGYTTYSATNDWGLSAEILEQSITSN